MKKRLFVLLVLLSGITAATAQNFIPEAKYTTDEQREVFRENLATLEEYMNNPLMMVFADDSMKVSLFSLIGVLYYITDELFDDAYTSFKKALVLNPDDVPTLCRYASVLEHDSSYGLASDMLEKAHTLSPGDTEITLRYAGALKEADRLDKSNTVFEKFLEANPEHITALNNYAYSLSIQGKDLDKAEQMVLKALELDTTGPQAHILDTHAWILYKQGRYEDAKTVMKQSVDLLTQPDPLYLVHYGDILFEVGDHLNAALNWKEAQELGYDRWEITKRLNKLD